MTNLIGDFAYFGENALDLYHLFVNELDSKIVDGYLNIGSFHLRILENDNKTLLILNFKFSKKKSFMFCKRIYQIYTRF